VLKYLIYLPAFTRYFAAVYLSILDDNRAAQREGGLRAKEESFRRHDLADPSGQRCFGGRRSGVSRLTSNSCRVKLVGGCILIHC
jgi:hypothetical protein